MYELIDGKICLNGRPYHIEKTEKGYLKIGYCEKAVALECSVQWCPNACARQAKLL